MLDGGRAYSQEGRECRPMSLGEAQSAHTYSPSLSSAFYITVTEKLHRQE